jgi:hypothetical protein
VSRRALFVGVLLPITGCASPRAVPAASPQPVSARVDTLSVIARQLRQTIDSLRAENDSLRRERAGLQLQLLRLKHIDTRVRAAQSP